MALTATQQQRVNARYVPTNATIIDDGYCIVYEYERNGHLLAIGYSGTSGKSSFHYRFKTAEQRRERVNQWRVNQAARQDRKNEAKLQPRKLSQQAQAAAAIRQELKKAFPAVKFSVKSDSFSMGDSVHVEWTDGPTREKVEAITDKYQYGSFDGMQDLYEITNSRDDIPQSKWVQAQRGYSAGAYLAALDEINQSHGWELVGAVNDYGHAYVIGGDFHTGSGWASHEIGRLLQGRDL